MKYGKDTKVKLGDLFTDFKVEKPLEKIHRPFLLHKSHSFNFDEKEVAQITQSNSPPLTNLRLFEAG